MATDKTKAEKEYTVEEKLKTLYAVSYTHLRAHET